MKKLIVSLSFLSALALTGCSHFGSHDHGGHSCTDHKCSMDDKGGVCKECGDKAKSACSDCKGK